MTATAPTPLVVARDTVALIADDETLTYAQLDARVAELCARLGATRKLVLLAADNSVDTVVALLAALRGGHPVMLGPAGDAEACRALADAYGPDVVIERDRVDVRNEQPAHALHPDLAVLLSTSGSTGTPKLVRLSYDNVVSNAAAIVASLSITASDVAITTLPMHYCYGLSVVTSYLSAGASIVLSSLSVVDRCFWARAREHRVTSFAGVPHTFDLLDRIGFDGSELPTLRYVTQAGGRMAPERVAQFASLGFDLVVMYGQTEATARMAYLPADLALAHPGAIGVTVPGGDLRIDEPDENGVGELVYRGPNVMLGYAHRPADLARGRDSDELRTGDLARRDSAGLFEIVGRRSRFIKPFGIRVDLDDLERVLGLEDVPALCAGDDAHLVIGTTDPARAEVVVAHRLGLPASHVSIVAFDELPRLANGKPDYAALSCERHAGAASTSSVRAAFATVFDVEPRADDTFVGLGGDSLSFVEVSITLEDVLGSLPRDWHRMTVANLEALAPRPPSAWASVDTSVVVRALAIVMIVGTHTDLWWQQGGAHALIAVAGFNFARFQLTARSILPSVARIAIPSVVYIGVMAALSAKLGWHHALLVTNLAGPSDAIWTYWFVEALVQISLVLALIFAIPPISRWERQRPFLVAAAAVALGLTARFDLLPPPTDHLSTWPHEVFWLFALGWAAARAEARWQRVAVAVAALTCVSGFFSNGPRQAIVVGTVALLVFVPRIRVPRIVLPVVVPIASASLFVYLTHIQVHPVVGRVAGPLAATLASLAVGVAAWRGSEVVRRRVVRY